MCCERPAHAGTGGSGHAAEYYSEFKYPLAVKLGTITPEGADVYSYPEDDMVTVCGMRDLRGARQNLSGNAVTFKVVPFARSFTR
jgi:uncharacterized UBP type Zn finger protein